LPRHLPKTLHISAVRILFRTNSYPDPNVWRDDFVGLSPLLIDYLQASGVILIGIDTPSIDPAHSKELESHRQIAKYNMANLEGIDLSEVEEGFYELIALPLKIQGGDASPVRAVLLQKEPDEGFLIY
jgi:arylformamidase